jgi:hypothetical protein
MLNLRICERGKARRTHGANKCMKNCSREGKKKCGRLTFRSEDNIKITIVKLDADWYLVNVAMNIGVKTAIYG